MGLLSFRKEPHVHVARVIDILTRDRVSLKKRDRVDCILNLMQNRILVASEYGNQHRSKLTQIVEHLQSHAHLSRVLQEHTVGAQGANIVINTQQQQHYTVLSTVIWLLINYLLVEEKETRMDTKRKRERYIV